MDEQSFSIKDVTAIFRRRARVILYTAGGVFLASLVIAAVLKDQFTVYTTILVEPQSISKKLVESGEKEQDVMNRMHLMTMQILSRARLSKVIDEFKLYPKESETKTREEVIDMMRDRISVEPLLPDLDPELKRKLDIQVNTFRLFFRHDDAAIGAGVANRLANDFIDEHIKERVQNSGDTADFVESELTRMTGRIKEIEAQIAQIKAQNAGSLPDDMPTNQRQIEQSFQSLSIAEQKLAEAESDQAFYKQQASVARESGLGGGGAVQNTAVLSPNQRLQQLENELGELRSRGATDKHPDVIANLAETEQVRERIKSGGDEEQEKEKAPTSVAEQQALAEAQRATLRTDSGQKEVDRIRNEIQQAQVRLANTPRVAEQLDALEREYKHLSDSFQDFSTKRLDASVAANMERRQKGEQFRVLEPAYAPPRATSPNRLLIVVLGLLLGVGGGCGLAFVIDAADSSYHEPRSLQRSLHIPVLAAIPAMLLDPDRARIRRRLVREAFAAVAVTGVVMSGALVGYVVVNKPHLFGGKPAEVPAAAPAPTPPPSPLAPAGAPPGAAPAAGATDDDAG